MDWKLDDKNWVQTRRTQWREMQPGIQRWIENKREDHGKSARISYLRNYFMEGIEPDNYQLELLEKLWLHPEQTEKNWDRFVEKAEPEEYQRARKMIAYTGLSHHSSDEHIFLEELQTQLFSYFYAQTYQQGELNFKGRQLPIAPIPAENFHHLWTTAVFGFLISLKYPPYRPICSNIIDYWLSCLPFVANKFSWLLTNHRLKKNGLMGNTNP